MNPLASILTIISIGLSLMLIMAFIPPENAQLSINVNNIQDLSGKNLYVKIFQEDGFLTDHLYVKVIPVSSDPSTIAFDLPAGKYAVTTFHDVNNNGELDTKLFGIPKEPYGFSNNFKPKFGPPSYEKCAVDIQVGANDISISLID